MNYINKCLQVACLVLGMLGVAGAETDEEAVQKAIDIFQSKFNGHDEISLAGDVDFEYAFAPKNIKKLGIYNVAELAGLQVADSGSAKVDTGEVAEDAKANAINRSVTLMEAMRLLPQAVQDTLIRNDLATQRAVLLSMGYQVLPLGEQPRLDEVVKIPTPPDLSGVNAIALLQRNLARKGEEEELVLRVPPKRSIDRYNITTAAFEYDMAERRLLRWDLDYLFESIPHSVYLFLMPTAINIQQDRAIVEVAYRFKAAIDNPATELYKNKVGALMLGLKKSDGRWYVDNTREVVEKIKRAIDDINVSG